MSKVFVLDTYCKPLGPVHPGWARLLLTQGKAAVYRRFPFTIILKVVVEEPQLEPLRIKLDPGSQTTGLAVVNDTNGDVVFAANLGHRGKKIKKRIDVRRAVRHSRRARHTRYRKPRFKNRRRFGGWLPPSLESRVVNVLTWVNRLRRYCPITAVSMELVKFDTQRMDNSGISGIEYQQGTLQGYEIREYLLEKWNRQCSYCGKRGVPLQVEHIRPRADGGTDRISTLCLACEKCNLAKGTKDIKDFLRKKPEVLKCILAQAKAPLRDTGTCNATRWVLYERLKAIGLPIECGSGGLTKFNRTVRELPKDHWVDALCVGRSTPFSLQVQGVIPLFITATGYGNRQMCGTDESGFVTRHRQRKKVHYGFQTGDLARAVVPQGTHKGMHVGRVTTRANGSFDLKTASGRKEGIPARYCRPIHRNDGYNYQPRRSGHSSPA